MMKNWNKRRLFLNLLGFVMGRCAFFSMNPVGIAYFLCLTGQDVEQKMVAFFILAGMATVLDAVSVIKYALIFLTLFVIRSLLLRERKKTGVSVQIVIGAAVTGALSLTKAFLYKDYMSHITLALLEGILVYIAAYLLKKGVIYCLYHRKKESMNNEELVSVGLLAALILYSLPDLGFSQISLLKIAAYFIVICMGYKYGSGTGAVAGAACGAVIAYSSASFSYIGILCILGICGGMFQEIGRLGAGIAFAATGMSLGYLYEKSLLNMQGTGSLLAAILVFYIIPQKLMEPVYFEKHKERDYAKQNIQLMTKNKFREFSDSLQKLSKSFVNYTEKKQILGCEDINGIFEDISGRFCKECVYCEHCWSDNYELTYAQAQNMFAIAKKNGYLTMQDIPSRFKSQCVYADSFVKETNKSLEIATLNMKWYNKLMESRQAIAGQLEEVAGIVKEFAQDITEMKEVKHSLEEQLIQKLRYHRVEASQLVLMESKGGRLEIHIHARVKKGHCITVREMASILSKTVGRRFRPSEQCKNVVPYEFETLVFLEDTKYKILTGVARAVKNGEEISGDNFSFLELDSGEMIMTLCDGMGSGEDANVESKSVIDLIEDFMEAGFKESSALHLINSLYVLKEDEQSFSTIDMGIVNLFSGGCNFLKMGASATFIKRQDKVEVITSTSLPAGIFRDSEMEGCSRKIKDGEFIVMMTDGVVDCFPGEDKESLIQEFIGEFDTVNPRELANEIVSKALERVQSKVTDDMTVIVAGIWEKA